MPTVADHPAVRAARARSSDLQRQRREVEAELRQALQEAPSAAELADMAFRGEPLRSPDTPKLERLQREVEALDLASQRARTAVTNTERQVRAEMIEAAMPRYRLVQHRLAGQVRALMEAAEDERHIQAELEAAGAQPNMAVHAMNPLPLAPLQAWLERAERF